MSVKTTTVAEAHDVLMRDPEALYLDVRTEKEFEEGHPPGAFNIPVLFFDAPGGPPRPNDRFLTTVRSHVDPARRLFVGCHSGVRSQRAAEILTRAGYQDVTNVAGGFGGARDRSGGVVPGWRDAGLPVETGKPSGRSYRELDVEAVD